MAKLNLIQHIISIIILMLLLGCSGSTEYIHRSEFIINEKTDTIYTERVDTLYENIFLVDTVYASINFIGDTIYPVYAGIKLNAKKDTAVIAKFFWSDKHFEIWSRADTLYKTDTLIIEMPYIPEGAEGWEKIIYIIGGLLIAVFVYKIRKKKNV